MSVSHHHLNFKLWLQEAQHSQDVQSLLQALTLTPTDDHQWQVTFDALEEANILHDRESAIKVKKLIDEFFHTTTNQPFFVNAYVHITRQREHISIQISQVANKLDTNEWDALHNVYLSLSRHATRNLIQQAVNAAQTVPHNRDATRFVQLTANFDPTQLDQYETFEQYTKNIITNRNSPTDIKPFVRLFGIHNVFHALTR